MGEPGGHREPTRHRTLGDEPLRDAMPMGAAARRRLGLVLLTGAAVAFSTAGFFTRLITADIWTMLFWRGLFSALFIAGYLVWQHRVGTMAAFCAIGRPGCLVVLCSTIAMVAFISALRLTTVANVAVVYATSPLLAAFVAWLWSRQRSSAGTLLASLVAVAGVVVMVGGSAGRGDLRGDLLALLMTLALAVTMVTLRHHRAISMVPAACLSTVLTAAVAWPLASPLSVTATDLVYLALFGVTQTGLGLLLLTLGSRWVSPAENALVGALDAPLAPLWVWLAFGEVPPTATLVGGLIVLVAVLAHLLLGNRRPPRWRRAATVTASRVASPSPPRGCRARRKRHPEAARARQRPMGATAAPVTGYGPPRRRRCR